LIDIGADLTQRLALCPQLHHVTRDADTDPSAKAHRVEYHRAVGAELVDIAVLVRRVSFILTPAIAGEVLENLRIRHSIAVGLLDVRSGPSKRLRPPIERRPGHQDRHWSVTAMSQILRAIASRATRRKLVGQTGCPKQRAAGR
jgi:hypothetical protein